MRICDIIGLQGDTKLQGKNYKVKNLIEMSQPQERFAPKFERAQEKIFSSSQELGVKQLVRAEWVRCPWLLAQT